MKKQPIKTAQTKLKLKSAFWNLYKTKPISRITIKEITDCAGYFRGTFYIYYESVYDILGEIEGDVLKSWEELASEIWFLDKYDILLDHMAEFFEQEGEHISFLISPQGDPTFQQKLKDTLRLKLFPSLTEVNNYSELSLMFEFIISGMLALITEWYQNERHLTAKEAVHLYQSYMPEAAFTAIRKVTESKSE